MVLTFGSILYQYDEITPFVQFCCCNQGWNLNLSLEMWSIISWRINSWAIYVQCWISDFYINLTWQYDLCFSFCFLAVWMFIFLFRILVGWTSLSKADPLPSIEFDPVHSSYHDLSQLHHSVYSSISDLDVLFKPILNFR